MRDTQASGGARRLARWLGLDGNPLRRRTDKIAARLAALLVAVFVIGAPVLSMTAIGWTGHAAAAEQQAARSWRQVSAVVQKGVPTSASWGMFGYSWVPARWTAPSGQPRTGQVPVSAGVTAGQAVRIWVDAAGAPVSPPLGRSVLAARETSAAIVAVAALGMVLLGVAWAGRWVLDRRRLAAWEAAWEAVGPRWTRRFRSLG